MSWGKKEDVDLSRISTKYRSEKSISGYSLSEVKSAIQKYIRRNNVGMAIKMLMEFYSFDYVDGGSRILTNCLHRLQIIYLEDIGIGNYVAWYDLDKLFTIVYEERKKSDRNRNIEIRALKKIVIILCKSKKIRGCSFMNSVYQLNNQREEYSKYIDDCEYLEEIGEVTFDLFEKFIKEKNWRSIVVFKRLILLKNEGFNISTRKEKKIFISKLNDIVSKYFGKNIALIIAKWEKDIGKLKEGYLIYFLPLASYLYGCMGSDIDVSDVKNKWKKSDLGMVKLDDFVYDKHVLNAKNNSNMYFAEVSSQVFPKANIPLFPTDFEIIYIYLKSGKKENLVLEKCTKLPESTISFHNENSTKINDLVEKDEDLSITDFPDRESKLDFIVRAQLVTSHGKTDTYYAKYKGKTYFVKGPFLHNKGIDEFIKIQNEKEKYGLRTQKYYRVKMKVDRWPERPGIGVRKSFGVDDYGYFLIGKSMIDDFVIIEKESKTWSKTKVVDLSKFSVNVFKLNDMQMVSYINNVGFRLKYNLYDFADRNFMLFGDYVYSIDENKKNGDVDLRAELKSKKFEFVRKEYNRLKGKVNKKFLKVLSKEFED